MDQVLAAAGVKPRTVLESDLGASICALVAAGLWISLSGHHCPAATVADSPGLV
jgi:hypothetical protein